MVRSRLVTLANLLHDGADFEKEEEIVRRAMAIMEHIHDTDSSVYADLLNNLGESYRERHDYTRAEELLHRSLALSTQLLGADSYSSPPRSRILASSRASGKTMRPRRRITRARCRSASARSAPTIPMSRRS